tara:strand:- start:286 stop:609 length:324 start_codon:yes stop_codon:yes gene_type:complete
MNKLIKINKLVFLLLFLYSCGVGEALQGKKRSDQGDEFLIDKKNPLTMPPDFDKLPKPGELIEKKNKKIEIEQSSIKEFLKNCENDKNVSSSEQSTSIECSVLKKIK